MLVPVAVVLAVLVLPFAGRAGRLDGDAHRLSVGDKSEANGGDEQRQAEGGAGPAGKGHGSRPRTGGGQYVRPRQVHRRLWARSQTPHKEKSDNVTEPAKSRPLRPGGGATWAEFADTDEDDRRGVG